MVAVGSKSTELIVPQYSFADGRKLMNCPDYRDRLDANLLVQRADRAGYPWHYLLRRPDTPRPADSRIIVVLNGGRHSYYYRVHPGSGSANWRRSLSGYYECYVVWGCYSRNGVKIFDSTRPARALGGRGAIYTRWPVLDEAGQLIHYGWEVRQIEFGIHARQPDVGDKLRLTIDWMHGTTNPGQGEQHPISLRELDELWQELITRAKALFDVNCRTQPRSITGP